MHGRWRLLTTLEKETEEGLGTGRRLPNVHPGDVLREDFLKPLGMTPYRLAKGIKLPQSAVSDILKGKRAITAPTALRLSRFFGTTARFWMNLQASYDLEETEKSMGEALEQIKRFPMPDEVTLSD
jgi:antitoxin HigA-1